VNNDQKRTETWQKMWNAAKGFFVKNAAIKIVSLLFAMLLWGYVMMETNPSRTKTVYDVPVSFTGESYLLEQGLAVRGDQSEILKGITVRVSTKLTNYTALDASDISASVSLRSINKADSYRLKINVAADDGTVLSYSPGELDIEVDRLATRVVPIEVEYSGELTGNYWKGEPSLGSQTVSVSGAAEDVSTVAKAICTIDLTDRTTPYNESMLLRYVDSYGAEINRALFLDQLPSVVVRMDILRMVTLPVNIKAAVLGGDALPANYEIYDVVATPPTMRLVGTEEALSQLASTIGVEQIDVSGATSAVQAEVEAIVPEGVTLLDDSTVTLYVDIREKQQSASFQDVEVEQRGLAKGLTATLSDGAPDVTVTGRISLIRLLEREDIRLYVDLTGLSEGTHKVPIAAAFKNADMQTELEWTAEPTEVTVTIGKGK